MSCEMCKGTGLTADARSFCTCTLGATQRIRANHIAIRAYRERGEPHAMIQHWCRAGCGTPVSACGTMCARCTEEAEAQKPAKPAPPLFDFVTGLLCGAAVAILAVLALSFL